MSQTIYQSKNFNPFLKCPTLINPRLYRNLVQMNEFLNIIEFENMEHVKPNLQAIEIGLQKSEKVVKNGPNIN